MGRTKNRARARIPTFFLVLPGFYVNWSDALTHLTISSQIHVKYCEEGRCSMAHVPQRDGPCISPQSHRDTEKNRDCSS
jgi:hypothetical protein